jgi:hypothetical protein
MKKYYFTGMHLNMPLYVFVMSDDSFPLNLKYAVRNTNYKKLVLVYGLNFPFY